MSAIASLTLLHRGDVPELARLARTSPAAFRGYLAEHGRGLATSYDWSGYCMLHVLTYLDDRDVDLESAEFDAEAVAISETYGLISLITSGNEELLRQLDPAGHVAAELADHFTEMGLEFEESGQAGLDGLTLLHDSVARLGEDEVLLLHIG
ncbi:hypothetical protein [Plantactinospora sp. B5E13]|uniref:hypothetical protein n=1 Tax=unclassified Plantactinospora TaxID=2631981 RepID=UPI00325DC02A